jgi:DinB family protein
MDDAFRIVDEMHQRVWDRLSGALKDLGEDEIHWRFLPQANSINVIVRHLRIEAEWHLRSLESGEPMPTVAVPVTREELAAVSLDFAENLSALERLYTLFCANLRTHSLATLKENTAAAYGNAITDKGLAYLLAYHQATHVAMHCGQIQTIRNLYSKTRGQPARFFPDNPTYPSRG